MEKLKVVCGVIWRNDKIFIARRKLEKTLGGFWEFPGGKIEVGENPAAALKRELREELGMEVEIIDYYDQHLHHYSNFSIELIGYNCKFISTQNIYIDHDKFEFVSPAELNQFDFSPADVYFVKRLSLAANI